VIAPQRSERQLTSPIRLKTPGNKRQALSFCSPIAIGRAAIIGRAGIGADETPPSKPIGSRQGFWPLAGSVPDPEAATPSNTGAFSAFHQHLPTLEIARFDVRLNMGRPSLPLKHSARAERYTRRRWWGQDASGIALVLKSPRDARSFSFELSSGKRSSAPCCFGPVHLQERRSLPAISNKNGEGLNLSP
jgi:hypothetical protein